jgi:hypothetical protein
MNLLIGQDTELFLKSENKFVSAYGVIPGSKDNPYPVKKGAVQVDGMALEINTVPAKNFDQFKNNINTVLSRLQDMIPENCEMTVCPTAHFDSEYINQQPPEAKMLGCDPDFNAYTGEMNNPPLAHPTMRTAAGHVHLGWTTGKDVEDPVHMIQCREIVKQLDYYIGIPSLLHDSDQERRQMYGKAGSFRPKHYGVEYRVLSNYWILQENYMKEIFYNCRRAFISLKEGKNTDLLFNSHGKHFAQQIINSGNLDKAVWIMDTLKI